MRKMLFVAVAASGMLTTSIAGAQSNRVSYGAPLKTRENLADLRMRGSAFCASREAQASSDKVLLTPVASKEERKAVDHLGIAARKCFPANFPKYPPTIYRNALAEATYRERYLAKAPTRLRQTQPPASFAVVPDGTKGTETEEISWQFAAIGRCVVFAAPAESRQLILGPRFVEEEEKRFAALKPALVKCVGQKNADALTPRTFRGFVGDALLAQAEGR
jgi:hypothetical protein